MSDGTAEWEAGYSEGYNDRDAECRREIERLRDENFRLKQEIGSQGSNWAMDVAEIERLREQLDAQATMIAECEDERMRLRHTVAIHKRRVREAIENYHEGDKP